MPSLGELQAEGVLFAGAEADVSKCLDQVVTGLVDRITALAGVPAKILDAYRWYQE